MTGKFSKSFFVHMYASFRSHFDVVFFCQHLISFRKRVCVFRIGRVSIRTTQIFSRDFNSSKRTGFQNFIHCSIYHFLERSTFVRLDTIFTTKWAFWRKFGTLEGTFCELDRYSLSGLLCELNATSQHWFLLQYACLHQYLPWFTQNLKQMQIWIHLTHELLLCASLITKTLFVFIP